MLNDGIREEWTCQPKCLMNRNTGNENSILLSLRLVKLVALYAILIYTAPALEIAVHYFHFHKNRSIDHSIVTPGRKLDVR